MLLKPDVVIFDMDGTTVRHLNPRLLDIMEKLDDFSYKSYQNLIRIFGQRKKKSSVSERKKYSPKLLVHRTIHTMRRKSVEQIVEPCPNIKDVLCFLSDHNIPMGLVSNGLGRGYGHDILDKFDLAHFFKATLFAEDLNRSKPDPEPILKILDRLKSPLDESHVIWYIGDRHKDIKAALNAQAELKSTISPIAYGYFGSACLAALEANCGTDHIIGSYCELLQQMNLIFTHDNSVSP